MGLVYDEDRPAQAAVYLTETSTDLNRQLLRERASGWNFEEYSEHGDLGGERRALKRLIQDAALIDVIICRTLADLGATWPAFEAFLSALPNVKMRIIALQGQLNFEVPTGSNAKEFMAAAQAFQIAERRLEPAQAPNGPRLPVDVSAVLGALSRRRRWLRHLHSRRRRRPSGFGFLSVPSAAGGAAYRFRRLRRTQQWPQAIWEV